MTRPGTIATGGPLVLSLQPQQSRAFITRATEVLYGGAAGGGKALALDLPIPTPTGWQQLGDIKPGDLVLGEYGQAVEVQAISEIWTNRQCYRLTFDDGETITASGEHLWKTLDAKELGALTRRDPIWRAARRAKRPSRATGKRSRCFQDAITARNKASPPLAMPAPQGSIRTTEVIAATLRTSTGRANHAIPCAAIQGKTQDLPVDPYVLGLWLGDGTRGQGAITQHTDDMEAIRQHIEAAGFQVRKRPSSLYGWGILGLRVKLRKSGILNERAIPRIYLRASVEQRLALFQGLMDSDGSADEKGNLEFTTTNRLAAETFRELANSLGIKTGVIEGRAKLNGKDCGPKWRINFTTDLPAFRLPRKTARQICNKSRRTTRFRYLIRAEKVPPVPVRCLQVAGGMFLAGRAMIPTHNSHLMRAAAIAWAQQIPGLQIAIFRRLFPDLVANHMEGPTGFPAMLAGLVARGLARIAGREITFPNGSRISLHHCQHANDVYRYQGAEFHVLMIDELTHFTEPMYRYLRGRCRMAGVNVPAHLRGLFPRILCGANPGGIGHVWVKKTFVAHGPMTIHRASSEEGGMMRQYIPAKLSDNPALALTDPSYATRLMGLGDPLLVRAMLDGDWRIAAGAMFGEAWREDRHECDPFPVPIDWPLWFGADDGFSAPASVHYITQHPSIKTFYVVAGLNQSGLLPKALAARMKAIQTAIPRWIGPNQPAEPNTAEVPGLLDNAAWADHGEGNDKGQKSQTRGAQLEAEGIKVKPVEKWEGARIHAVQNFHRLLAPNPLDPQKRPGIIFFKTCRTAIDTIQALPRDPKNTEDVDTTSDDHAWDSIRYGLQYAQRKAGRKRVG